ncbi:MAG: hypothetical protein FWG56_05965 [Desulfovibrionaceae bacterium]|jgi:hypothetical protein|nr:hypothetical protein [Desulfovibrionaceae bacterium]
MRELRPLPELRQMVQDVACTLDALCELLLKANAEKVFCGSMLALLEPSKEKLAQASCDLNDMRL